MYAMESTKTDFWLSRATPKKVKINILWRGTIGSAKLQFFISYDRRNDTMERILAARERFWVIGNEIRIETTGTSAHLYRSGMKMTIFHVDRDDYDNMTVEGVMDD